MTSLEQRVVRICWMDGDRKSDSPIVLSASLRKKNAQWSHRERQDSKWRKNKISENATPLVIIFDYFRAGMRFADITQS